MCYLYSFSVPAGSSWLLWCENYSQLNSAGIIPQKKKRMYYVFLFFKYCVMLLNSFLEWSKSFGTLLVRELTLKQLPFLALNGHLRLAYSSQTYLDFVQGNVNSFSVQKYFAKATVQRYGILNGIAMSYFSFCKGLIQRKHSAV